MFKKQSRLVTATNVEDSTQEGAISIRDLEDSELNTDTTVKLLRS